MTTDLDDLEVLGTDLVLIVRGRAQVKELIGFISLNISPPHSGQWVGISQSRSVLSDSPVSNSVKIQTACLPSTSTGTAAQVTSELLSGPSDSPPLVMPPPACRADRVCI